MKKILLLLLSLTAVICSYAVKKDTSGIDLFKWKIGNEFKIMNRIEIDTSINLFQIYNPIYKRSFSNSYLGNIGLPSKNNINFLSEEDVSFLFHENYITYNFYTKDIEYYYSERPFSNITFSSGANEEQILKVILTQNVNENFNFGLKYQSMSTDGFYLRQLVKHKSLGSWISYNSPYYTMNLSYCSNNNILFHNGGIIDDSYITDSTNRAENIIVKLNDSKTEMHSRDVLLVQKINISNKKEEHINDSTSITTYTPILSFGHSFQFGRYYKNYFDEVTDYRNPVISDTIYFDYFDNNFNYVNTFDSSYFNESKNELLLNYHENEERLVKFGVNLKAGIKNRNYSYFNKDTLFDFSKDTSVQDYYYGWGIQKQLGKKWKWNLYSIMTFKGYNEGDMRISGFAKRYFMFGDSLSNLLLTVNYKKQRSDYFLNSYSSNHFKWNNNFLSPEKTKIEFGYYNTKWKFNLGGNIGFFDNFIYFDTLALPKQETNTFDLYSAFLNKKFEFWKINIDNHLVYQLTENDSVLRLPNYNYFGSIYIEDILWNWKWLPKEFNNVLRYQLGIEVYYHSKYYGYEYMPSIEQFYIQNNKMIGNYPILNVFLNVKIDNTRIFIKYEHIDPIIVEKNPFTTLHYPLSESMVKFGLSWSFYN